MFRTAEQIRREQAHQEEWVTLTAEADARLPEKNIFFLKPVQNVQGAISEN